MKPDTIHIIIQPEIRSSFWVDRICMGIAEAAHEHGDIVVSLGLNETAADICGCHALVVGNSSVWLETAIERCIALRINPVIVNACMLPVNQFRCSGVIFELEEMIANCVSLLMAAGRCRIVLLGVNPDSATDKVKADAFIKASHNLSPDNIVWADSSIDSCVCDFANRLNESNCDSVICANDTVAICLVKCLTTRGYQLPERLYIIGIGNSFVGAGLALPLTSVMFDYHTMGESAVKLYHQLCDCHIDCHMTMSLPCRLIIRESAPLSGIVGCQYEPKAETIPNREYFDSDNARAILRIETVMQSSDSVDREILYGLTRGETCDFIAERLFFSDRAVRYRLSKLIKRFEFRDRNELETALKQAFML